MVRWSIGPLVECRMLNVIKVKLLSERTSGVPSIIFIFLSALPCLYILLDPKEMVKTPPGHWQFPTRLWHSFTIPTRALPVTPMCIWRCHNSWGYWVSANLRADSSMRCSRENVRPVSWWSGWGKPDHYYIIIVVVVIIIVFVTIILLHSLKEGRILWFSAVPQDTPPALCRILSVLLQDANIINHYCHENCDHRPFH